MNPKIIFEIKNCWVENIKEIYLFIENCIRNFKNGKYEIIFRKEYKKRSDRQNRYYWPGIIRFCARTVFKGMSEKQIHEAFERQFLPIKKIGKMEFTTQSEDLSDAEFYQYCEDIRNEMMSEYNTYIPEPNEVDLNNGQ